MSDPQNDTSLEYPVAFPLKVFVRSETDPQAVEAALHKVLDEGNSCTATRRESSRGAYVCLSFDYVAQNAEEVGRVRELLQNDPRVILSI